MNIFYKKTKMIISVMLVIISVLSMTACSLKGKSSDSEDTQDTIYNGVLIGGVDVSGLTGKEAIDKVTQGIKIPESIKLVFNDKDREISTSDIDVQADIESAVEKAMGVGRTGTEDERNDEIQAVLDQPINIAVEFRCNESKLKDSLELIKEETDLLDGDNKFNMDIDKTAEKVMDLLETGSFEDILPVSGDVENMEYEKTLIGSFSTAFSADDTNRNENLRVACEKINETVLQPGDIFDMNELLGPQTSSNGYKNAGVIENGKIVSAIAGGVCQVTTTMYNAAIFAELKIVERHCHSLMVGYVPLGRDAAVAGTYKNLRFQNDTDQPVYIEAYIDNYKIVCNIYGKEIHDGGHSVDFERVWVKTIGKPAEKVTVDANMYEDERIVTYTGKTGAKVDTYKLVYENGELVSRTWFSSSTYTATADEVTIGSKKREPVEEEIPVIGGESEIPSEPPTPKEPVTEEPEEIINPTIPSEPTEKPLSSDTGDSEQTDGNEVIQGATEPETGSSPENDSSDSEDDMSRIIVVTDSRN